MVTERDPSSFSDLERLKGKECIRFFGRTDITLTNITKTTDSMGKLTATSETTSTITGDLQFVTVKEKQYIDLGLAKIGDGVFYTSYEATINENDEITIDSVDWVLTSQVEGPQTDGNTIYQAWIAKRKSP